MLKGSAKYGITMVILQLKYNRPFRGFERHVYGQAKWSEITVFVWESDSK